LLPLNFSNKRSGAFGAGGGMTRPLVVLKAADKRMTLNLLPEA
jgi:hypothetical protein